MSGLYWGLTAMYLLDRLHEMDGDAIIAWLLTCQHENGGFGGSSRNDPHMLYTLSAVQILALYDKLDLVDADKVTKCEDTGSNVGATVLVLAHARDACAGIWMRASVMRVPCTTPYLRF